MSLGEGISKVSSEVELAEKQSPEVFRHPHTTAAWFAGVLEVGATASFSITEHRAKNGTIYPKTLPTVEIRTADEQMRQKLYDAYGGTNRPRYWSKAGRVAAEIIASTYPYAVARKEHAAAATMWLEAETVNEQIMIVQEILGSRWQQRGDEDEYRKLLENPAFVAGLLDSRGYIAIRTGNGYHQLYIQTTSKNVHLLNSLEESFGGRVRVTEPENTDVDHGKVVFVTTADTYVWDALGPNAINVVTFAAPYLQTKLPDNWEYRRSVERDQEDLQLAHNIAEYIKRELGLVQAGELARASSSPVLQAHFQISKKRLVRLLNMVMTPDLDEDWRKSVRKSTKATFTEQKIREIHEFIAQEIADFQEGKIDRISYGDEIAQRFEVNPKAIKKHIFSSLETGLKETRRAIAASQGTRERNVVYWKSKRESRT